MALTLAMIVAALIAAGRYFSILPGGGSAADEVTYLVSAALILAAGDVIHPKKPTQPTPGDKP